MTLNRAELYGESLFTSFRTIDGVVPEYESHKQRLFHSVNDYYFKKRLSYAVFDEFYFKPLELNSYFSLHKNKYFRLTFIAERNPLSRTGIGLTDGKVILENKEIPLGQKTKVLQTQEHFLNQNAIPLKAGSYFQNFYAKQKAIEAGYDDVLFCENDKLLEASTSSLIFQKGDSFYTPKFPQGIKSISLGSFNRFLESKKMELHYIEVNRRDLSSFESIFTTNCVQFLSGIKGIDLMEFPINLEMIKEFNSYLGIK